MNISFIQPETFGGSDFPESVWDQAFVSESGPTYANGPQARGKRIVTFELDANGNRLSGPTSFVEYVGTGRATVVGLTAGPDGLYFTDLYRDQGAISPIDPGARVLRVRYVDPFVDGDFTDDGVYDCADVDALVAEIAAGSNNSFFDLNGDQSVDAADLDAWLAEAGAANLPSGNAYLVGDANLDGSVDVSDFNAWNMHKFTAAPAWCSGDFNADGLVDVSDFNSWNMHKFTTADLAATAVVVTSSVLSESARQPLRQLPRTGTELEMAGDLAGEATISSEPSSYPTATVHTLADRLRGELPASGVARREFFARLRPAHVEQTMQSPAEAMTVRFELVRGGRWNREIELG